MLSVIRPSFEMLKEGQILHQPVKAIENIRMA